MPARSSASSPAGAEPSCALGLSELWGSAGRPASISFSDLGRQVPRTRDMLIWSLPNSMAVLVPGVPAHLGNGPKGAWNAPGSPRTQRYGPSLGHPSTLSAERLPGPGGGDTSGLPKLGTPLGAGTGKGATRPFLSQSTSPVRTPPLPPRAPPLLGPCPAPTWPSPRPSLALSPRRARTGGEGEPRPRAEPGSTVPARGEPG